MLMNIRNLIETNRSISLIYDTVCQNNLYRSIVFKKIHQRIDYLNQTKNYKFIIETSTICNAKCIFCPYPTLNRDKIIMTDEIFNLIIKRIKDEKINPTVFEVFSLNEPLTDPKIFERIATLKENFSKSSVRITSNFALATPEKIQQLLDSGLDGINISLNAASTESRRKIMDLEYENTVKNINKLIDLKNKQHNSLEIQISMVLCEENYQEAKKFQKLWQHKVDTVRLQRMHEWGGRVHLRTQYNSNKYLFPCNDIFERIPILCNGNYAICCNDSSGQTGKNITDTPILEAFSSSVFQKLRQNHLDGKIHETNCSKCMSVYSNGANWIFDPTNRL